MIYTKYFSGFTKENGQPNLNPEQFRRLMNIIFVEGSIQGMNQIKGDFKNEILLFKQDAVLTDFTGSIPPQELVREMYLLSGE